jgi:hypothetical protein
MRALALVILCCAAQAAAAATASGRNWRITVDSVECEAPDTLAIGTRVRYLGPKGPVEAPVVRLVDDQGTRHPPKSLVWKSGAAPLAAWLAAGGLANLQSEEVGEMQLKFALQGASGGLRLEYGDVGALALTRNAGKGICERLLKPAEIRLPRAPRAARIESSKRNFPVHRARYPCGTPPQLIVAEYPPYPPRQLLVFGRGYLPNAREIQLPMGAAPAQAYVYAGADDLIAVENAARRAIAADFPGHLGNAKAFAFNWGTQKAQSGNEIYSIGLYELRACPK